MAPACASCQWRVAKAALVHVCFGDVDLLGPERPECFGSLDHSTAVLGVASGRPRCALRRHNALDAWRQIAETGLFFRRSHIHDLIKSALFPTAAVQPKEQWPRQLESIVADGGWMAGPGVMLSGLLGMLATRSVTETKHSFSALQEESESPEDSTSPELVKASQARSPGSSPS